MSDIFLSYAREDRERALTVASALERSGWSVWWDRRLLAGEIFDEAIETELRAARAVVVLWSRTSVKSRWVRKEAVVADGDRKLVPALLDPVDVPLAIRDVQTASLTDCDGDPGQESFQDLLNAVRAVLERPHPVQRPVPEPEPRPELGRTVVRPVPQRSGPARDPIGPESGGMRVFRGCCLDNVPGTCRVAVRDRRQPDHRAYGLGIRPSRTLR